MRAFLTKYFCRHYLQTQNSLIKYITSQDFYNIIRFGYLRILDVGSGPAVTSLAITDVLNCFIKYLGEIGEWPRGKRVKVDYILNDTCSFCLGIGKHMLDTYFRNSNCYRRIIRGQTISIQKGFPDNLSQLQRIKLNIGKYDIATFSYVITPLNEEKGFKNLILGLFDIEKLCNYSGRILILQDRFRERLVKKISRAIGISGNIEKTVQQIYPKRNLCDIFTYFYYCCLYIPTQNIMMRQNSVA
jgi:ribosomal protein RSM22 (predicted rRNA methylase)